MAAFEYQALNNAGKTIKGITSGDSSRQIRQQLREQGLTPLAIKQVGESDSADTESIAVGSASQGRKVRRTKIKANELSLVTRQMATLLDSGLTVEETLNAMVKQAEGHQLKTVMEDVRGMVTEGYSLSDAIALYPRSFPEIYRSSVSAGEHSGNLGEVMDRLADYMENRQGIQQKLNMALVYPILLIVICVGIVMLMMTVVMPKVVGVFRDTGQELPILTRIMIKISDFMVANWLWMLIAIIILCITWVLIFRQKAPRFWLHRQYLRLPLVNRLVRSGNTARLARTLAIMVGSGVPLLAAMRATEGVVSNDVIRQGLQRAASDVAEGSSISRALDRSGHLPPLLIQMVASGEQSGRLDYMLQKTASATESELESRIGMMVGLLQPLTVVFMGLIIGLIIAAILLPIFDMNQLVG